MNSIKRKFKVFKLKRKIGKTTNTPKDEQQKLFMQDETYQKMYEQLLKEKENDLLTVQLGNHSLLYAEDEWITISEEPDPDSGLFNHLKKLRKEITNIREQNYLLKLKIRVLTFMLIRKQMELSELRGAANSEDID